MTKVSVIIPTYNSGKTIGRLLDILVFVKDIEIIVVDDGSTDDTINTINRYQNHNVRCLQQPHCGVSVARNLGIQAARGKYVTFIDADDSINISNFSECIALLDADDVVIVQNNSLNLEVEDVIKKIVINDQNGMVNTGPVSKFFRVKFLREFNILFPENISIGEDFIFNILAVRRARTLKQLKNSFYQYIKNSESVTSKLTIDSVKNNFLFLSTLEGELSTELFKNLVARSLVNDIVQALKSECSKGTPYDIYHNAKKMGISLNLLSTKNKVMCRILVFSCRVRLLPFVKLIIKLRIKYNKFCKKDSYEVIYI